MTEASPIPASSPAAPIPTAEPIVATAGRYYRNMRYLMTLGLLIFGAYFAVDGFFRWPAQNRAIAENDAALNSATNESDKAALAVRQQQLGHPHSDTDIAANKVLAFALPVAAVAFLVFILRRSRGEIRLENDVLHIPGHPPIPVSSITSIDSRLWKKKGIAFVTYSDGGKKRTYRLDDFIYQQKPIDAIYDRLMAREAVAG